MIMKNTFLGVRDFVMIWKMVWKSYNIIVAIKAKTIFAPIFLQLAQPVRLLLEYTGTKYEEKFYVCGEGNLPCSTNR